VHPVVGQVDVHFLIVGLVIVACQGDVLVGSADAAGELLWGVGGAEHEDPSGGGRLYLAHGVVADDAVFLYQVDECLAHTPLALWCLGLALHHLLYIIR